MVHLLTSIFCKQVGQSETFQTPLALMVVLFQVGPTGWTLLKPGMIWPFLEVTSIYFMFDRSVITLVGAFPCLLLRIYYLFHEVHPLSLIFNIVCMV